MIKGCLFVRGCTVAALPTVTRYCYDDSHVSPLSDPSDVVTPAAYVLFYVQRGAAAAATAAAAAAAAGARSSAIATAEAASGA